MFNKSFYDKMNKLTCPQCKDNLKDTNSFLGESSESRPRWHYHCKICYTYSVFVLEIIPILEFHSIHIGRFIRQVMGDDSNKYLKHEARHFAFCNIYSMSEVCTCGLLDACLGENDEQVKLIYPDYDEIHFKHTKSLIALEDFHNEQRK